MSRRLNRANIQIESNTESVISKYECVFQNLSLHRALGNIWHSVSVEQTIPWHWEMVKALAEALQILQNRFYKLSPSLAMSLEKNCGRVTQWKTTQQLQRITCDLIKQPGGWTSQIQCCMKEAIEKESIIWFHLCKIQKPRKTNLCFWKSLPLGRREN